MIDVSIIIPVFNGEKWIEKCMQSIAQQTIFHVGACVEIVVFNDGSNDKTKDLLSTWSKYYSDRGVGFVVTGSQHSNGVGAAKNGAVKQSKGEYLCFQDIDDVMRPNRVLKQWQAAKTNTNALIGSKIDRVPKDSTPRFVSWANRLSQEQLTVQIYTSNGPTILMPSWFCHRSVFDKVGGFVERGCGTPEDLIFFYAHLDTGGEVLRVDEELVIYTYHEDATTFSVTRERIWQIQLQRIEECVLKFWSQFTIWNAGKAGRRFVRALHPENQKKVIAFCDVDKNKVGRTIELYCPVKRDVIIKLPVVHFKDARSPFVICMKLDLTNGQFEDNLESLQLCEGVDYILFS